MINGFVKILVTQMLFTAGDLFLNSEEGKFVPALPPTQNVLLKNALCFLIWRGAVHLSIAKPPYLHCNLPMPLRKK